MPKMEKESLKQWVLAFYEKADAGVPLVELLPYVDESFHMFWTPTCQFDGAAGLEEFYRCLTGNLFDRKHVVSNVNVDISGDTARITFVINLSARMWLPPAPKSANVKNEAHFTWVVKPSKKTGEPVITEYTLTKVKFPAESVVVDADKVFKYPTPMPGPFAFPPE